MLALPPHCVVFCAAQYRTPADLYSHITHALGSSTSNPVAYNLLINWCCMASQAGTGINVMSSILSFAMSAIMGTTDRLHEWAHEQIAMMLGNFPNRQLPDDGNQ
jgi:hypothetical protein